MLRHLFCGHLIFFKEYILFYLFFTRNNYPNCTGNFEGRLKKIVMKEIKIMSGYYVFGPQ